MTTDAPLSHPGRIRAGLIALAFAPLIQSVWLLLAPRAFYDDFPGGGREWVSAISVYDEHLLQDFGAAQLGITVVLFGAAWFLERRLVQVALVALLASTVPHFLFHTTTTGSLATIDNVLSLGGFLALIVLAAWLLAQTSTARRPAWPASPDSRPRPAVR